MLYGVKSRHVVPAYGGPRRHNNDSRGPVVGSGVLVLQDTPIRPIPDSLYSPVGPSYGPLRPLTTTVRLAPPRDDRHRLRPVPRGAFLPPERRPHTGPPPFRRDVVVGRLHSRRVYVGLRHTF